MLPKASSSLTPRRSQGSAAPYQAFVLAAIEEAVYLEAAETIANGTEESVATE